MYQTNIYMYFVEYETDMEEDIKGDTSGYFQRLMSSLCQAARQECEPDDDVVEEDAENLIQVHIYFLF